MHADANAHARPFRIIAFGDSTTAPRGELVVFADLIRERLNADAPGAAVDVINAGVPSNTTEDARQRFESDVLSQDPDLVILQFGINDSAIDVWKGDTASRIRFETYVENLRTMVHRLKGAGVDAILMTPNPMCWTELMLSYYAKPPYDTNDPDGMNAPLRPYTQAVRDVAREEGVMLVDADAAFREYATAPGRAIGDLLLDGCHPNAAGHRIEADLLMPALIEALRSAGK
jgi:lysophospholipase L1-like esterase